MFATGRSSRSPIATRRARPAASWSGRGVRPQILTAVCWQRSSRADAPALVLASGEQPMSVSINLSDGEGIGQGDGLKQPAPRGDGRKIVNVFTRPPAIPLLLPLATT